MEGRDSSKVLLSEGVVGKGGGVVEWVGNGTSARAVLKDNKSLGGGNTRGAATTKQVLSLSISVRNTQ